MALKGVGRRVDVSDEDRSELERIVRAVSSEVRMVERARIVLAAAQGMTGKEIAAEIDCSLPTVVKWRVSAIGILASAELYDPAKADSQGIGLGRVVGSGCGGACVQCRSSDDP
ncbi:MAG: helix-turn-helix domain-containing protein [Solirubrobacteraceae bacterium]